MPNQETLGPAERIINTLLGYQDHLYHGRPGVVVPDNTSPVGVRWFPVTHQEEDGKKVVYRLDKVGRRTRKTRLGELWQDNTVRDNRRKVGEYRKPGLFPEVCAWMYRQAAEVYQLDNEFAARWASFAYQQEHRDLKMVLAALMLVQNRKGDPIRENDEVAFYDDDYRDVGEAMVLILSRQNNKDLSPKMLLRIHDLLSLPEIAEINRELGFGRSTRKPFYGRWKKVVNKWLRHREENLPLLEGLVNAGYRKTVMELARRSGYKPLSPKFFEVLRWRQVQAKEGHREIAIDQEMAAAKSWNGLTEAQICQKIMEKKPNYKRLVSLVPKEIGLTRAVVAASVQSGSLSDRDLIILTPTLEDLGLLQDPDVKSRWEQAMKKASDLRASHIAQRVSHQKTREQLEEAADNAVKEAVKEEMENLRIYFMVDISGSMQGAIEQAKVYLEKFLQAFPEDKIHIAVFNTTGKEIKLKSATAAGVRQAFHGIRAGGGTDYGAGVRALQSHQPAADEDVLFFFVGDEGASDFHRAVEQSGLRPTAFGFLKVTGGWPERRFAVQNTASHLQVPCFMVDEETFQDAYALPQTISHLIASTPVNREVGGRTVQRRESLAERILKTDLLDKPIWAQSA